MAENLGKAVLELTTDGSKLIKGISSAEDRASALSSKFKTAGTSITAFGAAGVLAIGGLSSLAISQESAFAGVKKTIDDTVEGFAVLEAELVTLSNTIPGTFEEFAGIAEIGGQLGIARENIVSFTEVIVRLGESTNIVGEQGATALARFINITDATQDEVSNLGSALVDLGNNAETTESEILNMATRIALSGTQAGLSASDILGFSTALSSAGIRAEAGGTSFSKFAAEINSAVIAGGKDLDAFAKIAGTTSEDFQQAFRDDAAGAITDFLAGLSKISESGGDVSGTLKEMGFESTEMQRVLLALSKDTEKLTDTLGLSGKAFAENTALMEESNKRFETSESQFKLLGERAKNLGADLGELLIPPLLILGGVLSDVIGWVVKVVDDLGSFGKTLLNPAK